MHGLTDQNSFKTFEMKISAWKQWRVRYDEKCKIIINLHKTELFKPSPWIPKLAPFWIRGYFLSSFKPKVLNSREQVQGLNKHPS